MTFAVTVDNEGQQLSEREVIAAARSIEQLRALRQAQGHDKTGALGTGQFTFQLTTDEIDAVLSVLVERHTVAIALLGITPDQLSA